jgi:DUF4097 and DUF4098 domain-containing protein YvlB
MLTLAALAVTSCTLPLSAEARDEWKRSYPLDKGGSVEIRNTNGEIRVEPTDGNTVDVVAVRVARAGTDEDARNALKRMEITETIAPNRVALDSTKGWTGLDIHTSKHVEYVVRVPKWAHVTLESTNGELLVSGMTGTVRLETTNGEIRATALEGSVRAETTNGDVTLDLAKLGDDGVTCVTTNGEVDVRLPASAKASLEIQTNNGDIETHGLAVTVSEKDRKDLRATIGGGGPKIKVETTNGDITVRGRS